MNSISFDGRVVADAEMRHTPSGDAVLSFRVASDVGFGDRKTTNWFSCQVWGKRGESLERFLKKGQQVTVYGVLTLREWEDRDGVKRLSPDVRVNDVSLQGGKREDDDTPAASHSREAAPPQRRQEQQAARQPAPAPRQDDMDDDIPF